MIQKEKTPVLFCITYFGSVQYYSLMHLHNNVYIEQYENFIKQTYRNRCEVLGANGKIPLVVPVVKGRGPKILIKDILISYDTAWQRDHWRTIVSAYNSSPFFSYYMDEFKPFFHKKWKYLFDFNISIIDCLCSLTGIETKIKLTEKFEGIPEGAHNLRGGFTPKKRKTSYNNYFLPQEYTQVFSEKFGFVSNLSILDLLFNEGPYSIKIIEGSLEKGGFIS